MNIFYLTVLSQRMSCALHDGIQDSQMFPCCSILSNLADTAEEIAFRGVYPEMQIMLLLHSSIPCASLECKTNGPCFLEE
jgi:hypothetical protein